MQVKIRVLWRNYFEERLQYRENIFYSNSISTFTTVPMAILKPNKYRETVLGFSTYHCRHKTLGYPAVPYSTLASDSKTLHVGAPNSNHSSQATHSSCLALMRTISSKSHVGLSNCDYLAQRHREEWYGQALLASVACNTMWLHANGIRQVHGVYLTSIGFLLVSS